MEEKGGKSSDSEVGGDCAEKRKAGPAVRDRSYEEKVVEVTCKASVPPVLPDEYALSVPPVAVVSPVLLLVYPGQHNPDHLIARYHTRV